MIANARITPADFKAASTAMNSVIQRRSTIPILGEVLISISAGKITFYGTDLDQQLTIGFEAETNGQASFSINAQHMKGFAEAAQEFVQINLDGPSENALTPGNVVELRTADITMRSLDRYEVSDFPKMSLIEKDDWRKSANSFITNQDELLRAITLGRHCISTERTRYYLNGSFLTKNPDRDTLRVVTTDGHRMGVIDTSITLTEDVGILPTGAVDFMRKHLKSGGNDPVSAQYQGAYMAFFMDNFEYATKLIDGSYPDYMRVIPKHSDKAEAQISSIIIKRLANINSVFPNHGPSSCVLDLAEGKILIKSKTGDSASAPLTTKGAFNIGLNFRYLQDQAKSTPNFTLQCATQGEPMRCFGPDPDALFILMPMSA